MDPQKHPTSNHIMLFRDGSRLERLSLLRLVQLSCIGETNEIDSLTEVFRVVSHCEYHIHCSEWLAEYLNALGEFANPVKIRDSLVSSALLSPQVDVNNATSNVSRSTTRLTGTDWFSLRLKLAPETIVVYAMFPLFAIAC